MRTIKLVIIGESGVGKTSLRSSYISGQFSTGYRATIGTDFITKTLPHHSKPGETITLQIWDTAGQERFSSLSSAFYRGADAVLMVYDVTKPQTLYNLRKWWLQFQDLAPVPDAEAYDYCCVVVGNKVDLLEHGNTTALSEEEVNGFLKRLIPPTTLNVDSPAETIVPPPLQVSDYPQDPPPSDYHESDDDSTAPPSDTIDNNSTLHTPIDIRRVGRGQSLSRPTSRSRFGGTMTTTHTGFSVYYTPTSSIYDEYISAPSSPTAHSRQNHSSGSPSSVPRSRGIATSTTTTSSSSDTITPSMFAGNSPTSSSPPTLDRGPKHFLASAKSAKSVPDIFQYIAKRVVSRWEWEDNVRDRMLEYSERSEIRTVNLEATKHPSWMAPCCKS